MTVEQFAQRVENYGQELSNFDGLLQAEFSRLVDEIRALAPVAAENGGALRSSIKLTGDRFNFQIQMLGYGVFQNYGVLGTKSSRIPVNVPEAGLTLGNVAVDRERFQFGTGNFDNGGRPWGAYYSGIKAQSFFSITELTQELTQFIQDNTEI